MAGPVQAVPYLRNTIVLKGDLGRRYEEFRADSIIQPGHGLLLMSDGGVNFHNLAGGTNTRWFAKENALIGATIFTPYQIGDLVPVHQADVGELILVIIPAGAAAIVKGDYLQSNGDGTFVKVTTGTPWLEASDAVNNSGGANPVFLGAWVL
jgi:hypothetical protein